ncbi:MAG: hypothetical protein ABR508_01900 [Candidatus Baltobacteraceae bacterium]
MASLLRFAAAFAVAALASCTTPAHHAAAQAADARCGARAAQLMNSSTGSVSARRYEAASRKAEGAARIWLGCGDRWRGANAMIVAAELAHQHGDAAHARSLVHQGFAIMHGLRKTVSVNAMQSSLLADKLHSAARDMRGEWSYW